MNLKQMTSWGKSQTAASEVPEPDNSDQCLTTLVEGTALAMPKIDAKIYAEFRGTATRMAMQIPDRMENSERLAVVKTILHQFENYRTGVETALWERQKGWRSLTATLIRGLLTAHGVNVDSPIAVPLIEGIDSLTTGDELKEYRSLLDDFLSKRAATTNSTNPLALNVADKSTANDNAAGLMGGGAAVERLKKVMERGGGGFVAIFRLSCLTMVSQRFGLEAVQDCLMAVSSFLTSSLHSDDSIFHWSDSSLVAILQGRANEQILAAELHRIASKNGDIHVNIGGRTVMLRIPLSFDLTPISSFRTADDLYKLSLHGTK